MGIEINTDSAGSATDTLNDGLGGASSGIRGILDFIHSIDEGFKETIRFLIGTFTGDWS